MQGDRSAPAGLLDVRSRRRIAERFRTGSGPTGDPRALLERLVAEEAPLLGVRDSMAATEEMFAQLMGLGSLEQLLADEAVTDVLVDGPGVVWVERAGRLQRTTITLSESDVAVIVDRLVSPMGLRADRSHPIVDARRDDGTRVAIVMPPVAPQGPLVALRRHGNRDFLLEDFADEAMAQALDSAVRERRNIVVYGPTGAGKTSLLTCLCSRVQPDQRVVLVEDTAELDPRGPPVVRLEARSGTSEGDRGTDMRDLVRAALRLRPDRIVVGEVRGPEAAEMIWALNTGHGGSMSTLHAKGPHEALARLEVMVVMGQGESLPLRAARAQVLTAVDLLVGVGHCGDGSRSVLRIDGCPPPPVRSAATESVG